MKHLLHIQSAFIAIYNSKTKAQRYWIIQLQYPPNFREAFEFHWNRRERWKTLFRMILNLGALLLKLVVSFRWNWILRSNRSREKKKRRSNAKWRTEIYLLSVAIYLLMNLLCFCFVLFSVVVPNAQNILRPRTFHVPFAMRYTFFTHSPSRITNWMHLLLEQTLYL